MSNIYISNNAGFRSRVDICIVIRLGSDVVVQVESGYDEKVVPEVGNEVGSRYGSIFRKDFKGKVNVITDYNVG